MAEEKKKTKDDFKIIKCVAAGRLVKTGIPDLYPCRVFVAENELLACGHQDAIRSKLVHGDRLYTSETLAIFDEALMLEKFPFLLSVFDWEKTEVIATYQGVRHLHLLLEFAEQAATKTTYTTRVSEMLAAYTGPDNAEVPPSN